MKKRAVISFAVVVLILMTMVMGCTSSGGANSTSTESQGVNESQAPAESTAAEETKTTKTDETIGGCYDLTKDTGFNIVMGGSRDDWYVNAPTINQYKAEAPYTVGFITSWRGETWQEVCYAEFETGNREICAD